ncbi:MAG: hypothetical protein HDT15_11615 [Oscillibacter sp.]|nr:hypothetical protein [Oscillibacter sp.]
MEQYYLANLAKDGDELKVVAGSNISKQECTEIFDWFSFTTFYHICRSVKDMTLESATDLERYLCALQHSNTPYSNSQITKHLTTGNKLLVNYLSFIKTFYDVISHAISQKSSADLKSFETLNSTLYDDYFGYRLFTRMRNYVVHYNMPLTTITDSVSSGVAMYCSRTQLLQYQKWSKLRGEIERLPEKIDIVPYIAETKVAITTLYLKSLETVALSAVEANQNIFKLCQAHKIISPVILVVNEDTQAPSVKMLPLHLLKEFFEDIKYHPNYEIEIISAE